MFGMFASSLLGLKCISSSTMPPGYVVYVIVSVAFTSGMSYMFFIIETFSFLSKNRAFPSAMAACTSLTVGFFHTASFLCSPAPMSLSVTALQKFGRMFSIASAAGTASCIFTVFPFAMLAACFSSFFCSFRSTFVRSPSGTTVAMFAP